MGTNGEDGPHPSTGTPTGQPTPPEVSELTIARARRGDQASFDEMYLVYEPYLRRHLRLTCGDRADDVSAAAWESVAGSLHRFRGDGNDFRRWLFTIARRRLVDDLRRSGREPTVAAGDDHPEPTVDFSSPLESAEWVEWALAALPLGQAEVISLRVVAGLPVAEVADLLGISEENVRVLSHRGLTALRASFDRSTRPTEGNDEKNRPGL